MSFHLDHITDEVVAVYVDENFDFRNASEIKEACRAQLQNGTQHFVFELSQTQILDSSGLGVLFALYRQVDQGQRVVIANPSDHVQEVTDLTNISKAVPTYKNVEEARASIEQGGNA